MSWFPTHRHCKGGLYRYLRAARHTETGEILAIYEDAELDVWARPMTMWNDSVLDEQGQPVPRFAALRSTNR